MSVFRSTNGNLPRALAKYEIDHPEDWQPTIEKAVTILAGLSPDNLRALNPIEIQTLENLQKRISIVLEDRQKLIS